MCSSGLTLRVWGSFVRHRPDDCSVPSSEGAPMAELDTAIDGLAAVDVEGMRASALGAHIRALMRARDRLDGQIGRALQVFDARGSCETDGAASTASWL